MIIKFNQAKMQLKNNNKKKEEEEQAELLLVLLTTQIFPNDVNDDHDDNHT